MAGLQATELVCPLLWVQYQEEVGREGGEEMEEDLVKVRVGSKTRMGLPAGGDLPTGFQTRMGYPSLTCEKRLKFRKI
jgi:hypothetical protein